MMHYTFVPDFFLLVSMYFRRKVIQAKDTQLSTDWSEQVYSPLLTQLAFVPGRRRFIFRMFSTPVSGGTQS